MKLITRTIRAMRANLDIRDAHVYGGTVLIACGMACIYWPLALIASGGILLMLALRRV